MFKVGLIVGRFQVFHLGHMYMVQKALNICDKIILFIGSSQESRTERNPLTFDERKECIRAVFPKADNLIILPLPDAGIGNTAEWGEYVLSSIPKEYGHPDIVISGKEGKRKDWFENSPVDELLIAKFGTLSATEVRAFMIKNDKQQWKLRVPFQIHDKYEALRKAVMESAGNQDTASI